jgi:hypothetical protein
MSTALLLMKRSYYLAAFPATASWMEQKGEVSHRVAFLRHAYSSERKTRVERRSLSLCIFLERELYEPSGT